MILLPSFQKGIILIALSMLMFWGCAPKKTAQQGLEITWKQGKQPFWKFLKSLSLTYDEKVGVRGEGFDAYGEVKLVNHHNQTLWFGGLKDILGANPTYYYLGKSHFGSFHPYPAIKGRVYEVSPGDTVRLYVVFNSKIREYALEIPVDSIEYSFDYRLRKNDTVNVKVDSSLTAYFMLKRTSTKEFILQMKSKSKEDKSTEKLTEKKQDVAISPHSLQKDFTDFLAKFPSINLDNVYYPKIVKENAPPDSTQIINPIYMRRFVWRSFNMYNAAEDTLINFVNKANLKKFSGQYVGKFKYPSDNQLSVVLIRLFNPENYYTTKYETYNLLCLLDAKTGEALGYDLISGAKSESKYQYREFLGKLLFEDNQLIIGRTMCGVKGPRCLTQKYKVFTDNYYGHLRLTIVRSNFL